MTRGLGVVQELARLYTLHSPLRKGKYRLALASMRFARSIPSRVLAKALDGRKLFTSVSDDSGQFLYFLGEYEPAITDVISRLVRPGDTCLDIGANIGWYTTLLETLVAPRGSVHSFEPLPRTFETLRENVALNKSSRVTLNQVALGKTEGDVGLFVFPNLPDSHASVSANGRSDCSVFSAKMVTLDSYLESHQVGDVTFVKADLEGSELAMLEGATRLFAQGRPPIFEIEMALATSASLGYEPNDLIAFLRNQADYEFFEIDEKRGGVREIEGFREGDVGANVVCVPRDEYRERVANLKIIRDRRVPRATRAGR